MYKTQEDKHFNKYIKKCTCDILSSILSAKLLQNPITKEKYEKSFLRTVWCSLPLKMILETSRW